MMWCAITIMILAAMIIGKQRASLRVNITLTVGRGSAPSGGQLDPVVQTTQFPIRAGNGPLVGAERPAFPSHESDFSDQGVSSGLELRFCSIDRRNGRFWPPRSVAVRETSFVADLHAVASWDLKKDE
jgi:hypothetical protein